MNASWRDPSGQYPGEHPTGPVLPEPHPVDERHRLEIAMEAVNLLSQAQLIADKCIEDAEQYARDLVLTARNQYREILQRAEDLAGAALASLPDPGAPQSHSSVPYVPAPEIEYVRTYAHVAKVQLRSVLDSLTEQVEKLGQLPDLDPTVLQQQAAAASHGAPAALDARAGGSQRALPPAVEPPVSATDLALQADPFDPSVTVSGPPSGPSDGSRHHGVPSPLPVGQHPGRGAAGPPDHPVGPAPTGTSHPAAPPRTGRRVAHPAPATGPGDVDAVSWGPESWDTTSLR